MAELGNGEGLNAALGAAASQLAAKQVDELSREIGGSTGGESGASAASDMDRYNRQLHEKEIAVLKELFEDKDVEERQRLYAAACSMVECYAEFPEGSPDYIKFKALAEKGAGYAEELAQLKQYQTDAIYLKNFAGTHHVESGMFNYDSYDAAGDYLAAKRVKERLEGAGQGVLAGAASIGSAAAGGASSPSGGGLALGIAGMLYFGDASAAGFRQALTGETDQTLLNQALEKAGFSQDEIFGINAIISIGIPLGQFKLAGAAKKPPVSSVIDDELRLPQSAGAMGNVNITSSIKDSSYAQNLAKNMSQQAQRDVDHIVDQLAKGNNSTGMPPHNLGDGYFEFRGRNGGRVIVKQGRSSGEIDIVGKFQGHALAKDGNSKVIERLVKDHKVRGGK